MEIQSVKKAMCILSVLSDNENSPVSVSSISEKTGFNKSTCIHILNTLMADGYVKKISHSKGYILGPSTYLLTRFGRYDNEFIATCRPIVRWLHKKTNYTIILAILQNNQKYIIDYIDENNILPNNAHILIDDIYRTATGRAMLACSDREVVEKIYEKYGIPISQHWEEVNSYESLCKELSKIKQTDIVKTDIANKSGSISIGYAKSLFKASTCVGALGIAIKCTREEYDECAQQDASIRKYLSRAASEINRRLEYSE